MYKVNIFLTVLFLLLLSGPMDDPVYRAEVEIVDAPREIVVVFNSKLKEVARIQGERTYTPVVIDWRWYNGTVTHNHPYPGLSTLSIFDLNVAFKAWLREIRAVSVGMKVCRAWRIKKWPRLNVFLLSTQLDLMIAGKPREEQEAISQAFVTALAQQYNFGYECHYE